MLGDGDWSTLSIAGAFVVGCVFATFATLRIVRAVLSIFDTQPARRRQLRRSPDSSGSLLPRDPARDASAQLDDDTTAQGRTQRR